MPVTTVIANLGGSDCGCSCCALVFLHVSFTSSACPPNNMSGGFTIPCPIYAVGANGPPCYQYNWLAYLNCLSSICEPEGDPCSAANINCMQSIWGTGILENSPPYNIYLINASSGLNVTNPSSPSGSVSVDLFVWDTRSPPTGGDCFFSNCTPQPYCCPSCYFVPPSFVACQPASAYFGTYTLRRSTDNAIVGSVTVNGTA